MRLAVVGLGRMGENIVLRLTRAGHECVVFDKNPAPGEALAKQGAQPVGSLESCVEALGASPRIVWLMLPAGDVTEDAVRRLGAAMGPEDIVIDGGNSHFKDAVRRSRELGDKGPRFVDCGTSGGVWGLERGYCLMIGGEKAVVDYLDPIFAALAPGAGDIPRTRGRAGGDGRPERGYIHAGPVGAGHFVKMIHTGVEYGMMQSIAEGFDIMAKRGLETLPDGERFDLDLADIAEVWRRGSVVSSWLLDLGAAALAKDAALSGFSGFVDDSGEGRWTLEAAMEERAPANALAAALFARFRSREEHTFGDKLLSAMRMGFGGHVEPGGAAKGGNHG
jgi:6-phosphogluconate dehydrogenase